MKEQAKAGSIDVGYVAHLARLALTDSEIERLQRELSQVVAYVDQLAELDLAGIEPTAHATRVENVFREDEPQPGLSHEQVMANAPVSARGQFLVPKILE